MEGGESRRSDTLEIPRTAIKVAAFLASSLLIAVSGVLWNNYNVVGRALGDLEKDVEYLKLFGPGTGKRFTWEDWIDHRREFRALERDVRDLQREVSRTNADRRISENLHAIQALAIGVEQKKVAENGHERD
jgi:hypothetical protein